jgi:hypothetical protein
MTSALVLDGDLRLAIGPQVGQGAALTHVRQLLGHPVGERDGEWHQLGGLVAGKADHHPLVAGAYIKFAVALTLAPDLQGNVDATSDVRRLLLNRDGDAARLIVEAHLRAGVADVADHFAHELWNLNVGLGRDLADHHYEPGGNRCLAGHSRLLVVLEDRV